jgi:hypothetical protein
MGGGGSKKVKYKAPKIPQDTSFQEYLKYQKEREAIADQRAAAERAEQKAEEEARRSSAQLAFGGLRSGVEAQLRQGLITYGDATGQLRDYAAKYGLQPPEQDVASLTQMYTSELLPQRRQTGISAAYEEMLGRQATQEELQKATERFGQGYYSSVQDLRDSLSKSQEYQDKYNQSYLDNYYDTMFGKQTVDSSGKRTGQRTFKFDSSLLPAYTDATKQRTGIETPKFNDQFTGTPTEIEEQLQNVRDTRQYLYSAGLTNLQGEIDKETQKLKNEGSKEVTKIGAAGQLYSNLVSGFWG